MASPIVRIETSTSITNDEVVTFESAVRWLRAQGVDDQLTILECLQGAVNDAEIRTNRTLRKSVTRTIHYCGWMLRFPCPFPPLISVSNVKYYDEANTLQTISSADYDAKVSTLHQGFVEFESDYDFPTAWAYGSEPVQITMVTGHATSSEQLPIAKTAIRLLCMADYDTDSKQRIEAYRLLNSIAFRGL